MEVKKTKRDPSKIISIYEKTIQQYSALLSRARLMARLGQSYDNERDLYEALGYPLTLTFDHYAALYEREAIAKAVINRPVEATWRGPVNLMESDDPEETELEKAWKELSQHLGIKSIFSRLDKLSALGEFGILLLGLDDITDVNQFSQPVSPTPRKLLYAKPLSQKSVTIASWETDMSNERYGLPVIYKVVMTEPGESTTSEISVHYSRVIHVPGELLESEVSGVPCLESVYNRIKDLEKLVGASAEMFWRGARPGYQGVVDPEFQLSDDTISGLQDQLDEYEHNLRRFLVNEGIKFEPLTMQVADPAPHVDIQLQMISAVTGIPKRILTGSERGELSSTEDRNNWLDLITARREEFAEPQIIRPFVNLCVEYKILPEPKDEYVVSWTDLYAQSEMEKAEIGRMRASALKEYTSNLSAEAVVPPDAFFEFFLGLSEDERELIQEMQAGQVIEEVRLSEEE